MRGNEKQKPRSRKKCVRILLGMMLLLGAGGLLSGCRIEKSNQTKVRDLEYAILAEEDLPTELKEDIEGRKAGDFKMTYETDDALYIVRGYGEQETGGYSICLRELYLSSNAVVFSTELIGPRKGENITKSPSYPYIVVKTEKREESTIFD